MPKISQYPMITTLTGQELILMDTGIAPNRHTVTATTATLAAAIQSGIGTLFTPTTSGSVPASGGGTSTALRADGAWTATFTGTWTFGAVNTVTLTATTGNFTTVNATTLDAPTGNITTVNATTVNATTVAATSQVTVGASNVPVYDSVSGNVGYYARTAAEIAASVTPVDFVYAPGDVRRYGADPTGAANSSPAFTSAFAVKGRITAVGSFLLNSGVSMDISTTTLIGPATLTSGLAANAGGFLTVTASGQPEANTKNKISQIFLQGQQLTGVQGIDFAGGVDGVSNFTVESCTITGFADGAYVNTNSFEIEFNGCSFSQSGTDHAALYAHFSSTERVSCVQCAFFNNTECVRVDSGGEVFLDNCSVDYSDRLLNATFGDINATNCYFENGSTVGDLDYWFKTGANDSTILLIGGKIAQTISKTSFAIGQSLAIYGGGIFFRNVKLYSTGDGIINPIIAGTGNAFASGCMVDGFSNNQHSWTNFSIAQNLCSNGTFVNGTSGAAYDGWTIVALGAETPTTSANNLIFQVTTGGDSLAAYWTTNAQPGENVGFTLQMKGNATTCQYGMVIRAMGADGSIIATSPLLDTFNAFNGSSSPCPTTYTQVRAVMLNLPAGTATCQFEMNTLGATSSANIIHMQNVLIGKY